MEDSEHPCFAPTKETNSDRDDGPTSRSQVEASPFTRKLQDAIDAKYAAAQPNAGMKLAKS